MTALPARSKFRKAWPFLADQTPLDGSPWRFAVGLAGGLVAAGLAALILAFILAVAVGFGQAQGMLDLPDLPSLVARVQDEENLARDLPAMLMLLGGVAVFNGVMFVSFVAFGSALYRRRLLSYLTAAARFRWRLVMLGALLFTVTLGPLLFISQDLGAAEPGGPMPLLIISEVWAERLLFVGLAVVALLVAAAAEEILFRGWMLRHLCAMLRWPWVGIAAGSLLFSAIHIDFNPDAFIVRAVMGAGLCYATLRLGGVEFALGIHAANNLLIVLFLEPMKITPEPPHPLDPAFIPAVAVLILAYVAMVEAMARIGALRRWSGVDLAPSRAPDEAFA